MKKDILTIIKDEKLIKKLYQKTNKMKKLVLKFSNIIKKRTTKIFLSFFIPILICSFYSVFSAILSIEDIIGQQGFPLLVILIIGILAGACSTFSYLLEVIVNKIINSKTKMKSESISAHQIEFDKFSSKPRINNLLVRFEKSLSKKETEYLKAFYFFKADNEQKIHYDIYSWSLHNTEVNCLIENKKLIIRDIKNNFNVNNQKKLLNSITKIIQENTIDKELYELETAIDNMVEKNDYNKKTLRNNVLIKNI